MPGIPATTATTETTPLLRRLRFYRGWWIVATGLLCNVSMSSAMGWAFSLLIVPMEAELHWSRTQLVIVLTVAHLLNGGLSAVLGPVVDRHGPRWLMTIGAFVSGASMILVNYVTAPWQYYLILGLGLAVADASLQNLGPVTAIANWFVRKRAKAFTVSTLGAPLSGTLLIPLVAWLISSGGWRSGWIALGLLNWCIVPLAWFAIRRRPEDVGLLPDGDAPGRALRPGGAVRPQPDRLVSEPDWTVQQALRSRSFWLLTVALSLFALAGNGLFIHTASYIVEKGFSPNYAAFALTMNGLALLVGRLIWGFAITRLGIRPPFLIYGIVFGLSIVLFILPTSAPGILATMLFIGFVNAGWPLFLSQALPDYFGRQIVGSLMGYAGIFLTSARAISPLLAALLRDATQDYILAFSVFSAAAFVGAVAVFLAPPPRLTGKSRP